jgi:hypothetical protein
MDVADD